MKLSLTIAASAAYLRAFCSNCTGSLLVAAMLLVELPFLLGDFLELVPHFILTVDNKPYPGTAPCRVNSGTVFGRE